MKTKRIEIWKASLNIMPNGNTEPLVNLADYNKEIAIDVEEISRSMQKLPDNTCYVRKEVAKRLSRVQRSLPKGLRLKVIDGYRPISAQKKIYRQFYTHFRKEHLGWDRAAVIEEVDKWVANPYIQVPSHSTGGTLDLTIEGRGGRELDMGTPVNTADDEKAKMRSSSISSQAKRNRRILEKAMSREGFVNYELEWWHWSYGDWRWAVTNHRHELYGIIGEANGKKRNRSRTA